MPLPSWILDPLWLTLWVAILTFILHATLGVALAWYLSGRRDYLKALLDVLVSLPLVFPPIALGLVLLWLLGKNGVLGSLLKGVGIEVVFTPLGVLIASFIAGLPLVVKPIQSALDEQDRIYSEASYVLGKGRLETLWRVLLPSISKVIFSSLFLGLGRSLGEVGITLMLGGNIIGETDTMSLAIYNHAFGGEMEKALVLCGVLGFFSLSVFAILRRLAYEKQGG